MQAPHLSNSLQQNPVKSVPTEKSVTTEKIINVKYQSELNLIIVRGSSIGDYSAHKYDVLVQDIQTHFKRANSLHLYFNFDFLDSSALAYLSTAILVLNEYHERGKMIRVFWSCLSVADNMNDEGEKLKSLCKFEFRI